MVKSTKHLDRRVSTRFFPNLEILAKEHYPEDQEVFFGVCPRETMKPEKARVRFVTALWAGLDLGPEGYSGKDRFFFGPAEAAKAVRSFPLPPSIIIESGRGMHLYWLLRGFEEIADRAYVEHLLRKITDYFQCGNQVGIDAMLRLPGTFNCKHAVGAVPCDIKYMNVDFNYALEDFEHMNLAPEAISKPQQPQTPVAELKPPEEILVEVGTGAGTSVSTSDQDLETVELGEYLFTEPEDASASDIEPLFYEASQANRDKEPSLLTNGFAERVADRIVEKVVENLSKRLMDQLADEIVAKLARKLTSD
ncbi:MAG: hypothetical protein V1792_05930 [Pseudomonadota bacterium]